MKTRQDKLNYASQGLPLNLPLFVAFNRLTGLYYARGKGFTVLEKECALLSPVELAILRASYENVEGRRVFRAHEVQS